MKRKIQIKVLMVLMFTILTSAFLSGQENWTIKNTSNSPLVNNVIIDLYQDNDDNIWIGTMKGLNMVDGEDWQLYNMKSGLPANLVRDIIEDDKGNLWMATPKGVAVLKEDGWQQFTVKEGLIHKNVNAVEADSKGNIWVGTKKGVSIYNGKDWSSYGKGSGLIHPSVLDIMEDQAGNIWFATAKGVSVFDGKDWLNYSKEDGLARNFVWSMDQTSNGTIWFGTHTGAFNEFNGSDWEYIKHGSGYYDWSAPLAGLALGLAMSLWVPPLYASLAFWATVGVGAAPSAVHATVVYIDSNDKIWLSAQPKGVFMFNGKDWIQYTNKNGLPHKRVYDILETNDGDIWFGTKKGIGILEE